MDFIVNHHQSTAGLGSGVSLVQVDLGLDHLFLSPPWRLREGEGDSDFLDLVLLQLQLLLLLPQDRRDQDSDGGIVPVMDLDLVVDLVQLQLLLLLLLQLLLVHHLISDSQRDLLDLVQVLMHLRQRQLHLHLHLILLFLFLPLTPARPEPLPPYHPPIGEQSHPHPLLHLLHLQPPRPHRRRPPSSNSISQHSSH